MRPELVSFQVAGPSLIAAQLREGSMPSRPTAAHVSGHVLRRYTAKRTQRAAQIKTVLV